MSFLSFGYLVVTLVAGLLLARALPLPRWTALLVGPALSLVLTTELILITSLVLGFSGLSAGLALVLSLLISLFLAHNTATKTVKLKRQDVFNWLRHHWPFLFVVATIGSFAVYIFVTQVLAPSEYGLLTGGGGLYGDTALHSAYTMSMVEQGIPPKNPLFAPLPLIYPFLVNLFSATLVLLGSNLRFAFILPQIVYFFAFLTLFYALGNRFTTKRGSLVAMLIFFLGWGFGFVEYLKEVQTSQSWLPAREYTNNMGEYHLHNVLTGLIFPERSFLPGLVIGLTLIHVVFEFVKTRKPRWLLFSGVLLGILPLWHTHTFLFFGASLAIWLTFHSFSERKRLENIVKLFLTTFLPTLLLSLPVVWWFSGQVSHESFLRLSLGWIKNAPSGQLLFWLKNAGLVLPLAIVGWLTLPKEHKRWFVPAGVMFVVANTVIFQPWEWDNIKLLTWVFLFGSILVGTLLVKLAKKGIILRLMASVIIMISIASGTLSLIQQSLHTFSLYTPEDLEMAEWVKANTLPDAIFLIDPWPNHPIPGLTGRSAYVGYPGHLWVHGIEYYDREQAVKQVFAQTLDVATLVPPIDFVVANKSVNLPFPSVFSNDKFTLYQVTSQ